MNLDKSNPIVEADDPDFLWHSNNALRRELSQAKKDLAKAQKKIKDLHWSKNQFCLFVEKGGGRDVFPFFVASI